MFVLLIGFILAIVVMGKPNVTHKNKPVYITQVYDLQFMSANTIYQQMDNMHKQRFIVTDSKTYQQFDVTTNLWTTKWEVHYVKQ